MKQWYTIDNPETLDTPALVIYPDRVAHNIKTVKSFVDDVNRLRPHIKTNKNPEVVKMMLDAGITRFKCATIAEAEMAASLGVPDLLLAYPPLGPRVERFCALVRRFPKTVFSCLVDHETTAASLNDAAVAADLTLRVYIDLNVGMNRTGIVPSEALALARQINALSNLSLIGLHAYDGHLRDPDFDERTRKCDLAFAPVTKLADDIARESGQKPAIVAGGTPTFPIHAKRKEVEVSPGTFIFWDAGYNAILKEQPFQFAALVVTRVISKPGEKRLTTDLGHKAIASENPLDKRVVFLNREGLVPVGHSEEHLVLEHEQSGNIPIGEVLYGVPYHVCPTVALYNEAAVCQDHTINATWSIAARPRKINL